jgi:uncharacterized protein (DUF58 family)
MLTARGWSVLVISFLLLAVAMLDWIVLPLVGITALRYPNTSLELLALTLTGWFWWEWLVFAYRARVVIRKLRLKREILDDHGAIDRLWARQAFQVRLMLVLPSGLRLPYVRLTDQLPQGADYLEGASAFEGALDIGEGIEWTYKLRCTAIGAIRFEGVRIQLADPQGFFYFATFLRGPDIYKILPPLADDRGHTPTVKRINLLPPPGVHRVRRAGSGSELLDLRDYQPGDPPKTIAWKASARRDRLITKEFESEVPLRCTLFLDTSQSVRRGGPGNNALTRLAEVVACVAQANAAARDLTGLCLFDETGNTYLRPGRGPRHLAALLNCVTDAAGLSPTLAHLTMSDLLPTAYAFAERVYPDELRREVNHFPDWIPWLWPQPGYTLRRPGIGGRLYQRLPWLLVAYVLGGVLGLAIAVTAGLILTRSFVRGGQVMLAAIMVGLIVFAVALTLFKVPGSFFASRRRDQRWRKQLAALFSVRYGLAPGGLSLLSEDEDAFADYLQRFLSEHRVPVTLPRTDAKGRPLFVAPEKVRVLAEALMRGVAKEHDNELFVLFADLLELADDLDPLVRAVKVAIARHHQVLLVLPWPKGMPLPERDDAPRPGASVSDSELRRRLQQAFRTVRKTFGRFGVPVIAAAGDEPTRLILDRLERLRLVGGKR